MSPTDADRQRAQDVAREIRKHLFSSRHPNTGAVELGLSWEANDIIAAAIAAARAEAQQQIRAQVLEEAAKWLAEMRADDTLKEPGHGK